MGMSSLRENESGINPLYHCVLVLIGYRIDLLIFVPTNGIRLLLLSIITILSIIIITKRIEQILILSSRKSTERVGPEHSFFTFYNAIKLHSVYYSLIKGVFPWVCLGIVFIPSY